jgi:hypothetical protein
MAATPRPSNRSNISLAQYWGFMGGEDNRINQTLDQLIKAMSTYKKYFEMRIDPGAAPCLL